jgi:hypothetical protein
MDYDRVSERVVAGLMQGFVVAFVGLAAFLPASYVMNRFIYRSWAMRGFMGVLAALTGMGGLVILLLLRAYWGDTMQIHYFGLLPVLTETPESEGEISYVMWFFKMLKNLIVGPLTFYYTNNKADKDGYAATIQTLLENFNNGKTDDINTTGLAVGVIAKKNTVSEQLFQTARELGAYAAVDIDSWKKFVGGDDTKQPDGYTGLNVSDASVVGKALFT